MNALLAYFTARLYTYTEIPAHYVYKQYKENGNKVFGGLSVNLISTILGICTQYLHAILNYFD